MNEIETFYGLVENTLDALRIFQMCRDGRLNRVRRRLHERERRLIRSGSVFVFDEEESGIKRWTDGRLWSPSRILGNFLIYRELEKKGRRQARTKRPSSTDPTVMAARYSPAIKTPRLLPRRTADNLDSWWMTPRSEQSPGGYDHLGQPGHRGHFNGLRPERGVNPQDIFATTDGFDHIDGVDGVDCAGSHSAHHAHPAPPTSSAPPTPLTLNARALAAAKDPMSGESLRVLKSKKLTNNHKGRYVFKTDGLIKKTISIQMDGHTHHLVAYYALEDFCRGHLQLNAVLDSGLELVLDNYNGNDNDNDNDNDNNNDNDNGGESPLSVPRPLPFDPQLMELLRQVPIPVDLMVQQNFRKPAALLASATTSAHGLLAGHPEDGEKLITALEYGAINPSDLQTSVAAPRRLATADFVRGGGIIFSTTATAPATTSSEHCHQPRPRRHSSFHPAGLPASDRLAELLGESVVVLDEASQLSGEALDFLSQCSPDIHHPEESVSAWEDCVRTAEMLGAAAVDYDSGENEDLETEIFASILTTSAIRGEDVLLSNYLDQ